MAMGRPQVLIVTLPGFWSGVIRLPRILRRAGAGVILFAPRACKIGKSRFLDGRLMAPAEPAAFAAALREHLTAHGDRYSWIVYGDEPTLKTVWASREGDHWPGKWFPVSATDEGYGRILDKAMFVTAAKEAGLPLPKSVVCQSPGEVGEALRVVGMPAAVKAAEGWGGSGVRRVRNAGEWEREASRFWEGRPLIVQEWVEGQVGSTQLLLDHGVPICWLAADVVMSHPVPIGPSCVRRLVMHPEMEALVERVGRLTQFHGLCGMDWIRREDGSLVVLEFNPRPTPAMHLSRFAGADVAIAIRAMLSGSRMVQRPRGLPAHKSVFYMFPQHIWRCIETGDWWGLRHWASCAVRHDVPWSEPWIMWDTLREMTRYLGRKVARLWN